MTNRNKKYEIMLFDESLLEEVIEFIEKEITSQKKAVASYRGSDRELIGLVNSNINRMKDSLSCLKQYLWLDRTKMDQFDEYVIRKTIDYFNKKDLTMERFEL